MNRIPLFDAHCDTALWLLRKGAQLRENDLHVDLVRGADYCPYAQFFALFAAGESLFEKYQALLFNTKDQLYRNADLISLCTSRREVQTAFSAGKAAGFLSVEGAELLDCSEKKLEDAYIAGVRAVTITWNFENELAGSNQEGAGQGLTAKGRAFVRRCQKLGVLVDVSHLSEPAFWDIMDITSAPIIATHSNARAVYDHPRNLTDDQFCAIRDTGGTVGINLYSSFLGPNPDLDTVIAHIAHFLDLGGESSISLGSDFDGCDTLPEGITGIESMCQLYKAMKADNYSDELLHKIFFQNLMDIIQ